MLAGGSNGWQDSPESESEDLNAWESQADGFSGDEGKMDPYEGWPEGSSGPEYWLNKKHADEEDTEC